MPRQSTSPTAKSTTKATTKSAKKQTDKSQTPAATGKPAKKPSKAAGSAEKTASAPKALKIQTSEARAETISSQDRERMVQYAAYHIAERDGFQSGREQDYWFQAEQQISDLLNARPSSNQDNH